ncbi:MAG: hypothetical protein LBB47_03470 [Spirochaetaceae bacterium]|nr:hypothetical protein [Spirochaetaceae bacterium]
MKRFVCLAFFAAAGFVSAAAKQRVTSMIAYAVLPDIGSTCKARCPPSPSA